MSGNQKLKVKPDPTFSMAHPGEATREYPVVQDEDQIHHEEPLRTVTKERVSTRDLSIRDIVQSDDEVLIIQETDEVLAPSQPRVESPRLEVVAPQHYTSLEQDPIVQDSPVPESPAATDEPDATTEQQCSIYLPPQPVKQSKYNLRELRAQPGRWNAKASKNEYGLHIMATK